MVRGGKQLLPLCRALGRQFDNFRGGDQLHLGSSSGSSGALCLQAFARCLSSSSDSPGVFEGGAYGRAAGGHVSSAADSTQFGSSPGGEDAFGAPPRRDETNSQAFPRSSGSPGLVEGGGAYGGLGGGNFSPVTESDLFGSKVFDNRGTFSGPPPRDEKLAPERGFAFPPGPGVPGAAEPKHRNDRFFRSKNNSVVANMLKLLEAARTVDDVEKILDDRFAEIKDANLWPWIPLLDALQKGPKPYLALEVFYWKKEKFEGGDPREYAKMISTAGRLNQLELATTLFTEMEEKGVKRSPVTCNALISAYSKNDQIDLALDMFKKMQESEDCKPTLVTYNTLISMYSKVNAVEMRKFFDLCKSSGFYPDRVTFNSMIWGYMRAREFDKMEQLYEDLKDSGCKPDPITFSALIIGFSKANEIAKMELAFSHMQEEGYPITTMIAEILTEVYAVDRKFEKLERIMKIVTNTQGASCSSRIYGLAVQSYAETGHIREMEETMEKMFATKRLFTSAKTLESVISAYGSRINFGGRPNFDKLDQLLQKVKSMGWSYQQSTFHALLYEYGKEREFERMEEVFKEMQAAVDIVPTEETYKIMADSYHAAGDGEGLKRTADRMSAAGFSTREVVNKEVDRVWTDDEIFGGKAR